MFIFQDLLNIAECSLVNSLSVKLNFFFLFSLSFLIGVRQNAVSPKFIQRYRSETFIKESLKVVGPLQLEVQFFVSYGIWKA